MQSAGRPYDTYTPQELADQYDTSKPLSGITVDAYLARFAQESERARLTFTHHADLRYGPHERERLDAFPARAPGSPLLVWVHGGYWRRLSKDESSFVARPVLEAGGAVAVVNYPLAPAASLDDIVAATRRAFAFARANARAWNADPERIFVGGHSVGAQLAAAIAAAYPVGGLLAISGLYDLEPLRATPINATIAMDAATAARNSPVHLPPAVPAPLVVSAGGREQSEFHRQQTQYVAAWRAWGGTARTVDAPDDDHFSILLELATGTTALARALRELMSLA